MNIENNKHLFSACVGLTASGSDGYDHRDTDIAKLAHQIYAAQFSDALKAWFARARTGQVKVNPYWPRGSYLGAACFFVDDAYHFDVNLYFAFIESAGGISDPIDEDDFRSWILELPDALRAIDTHSAMSALWHEYCHIIDTRSAAWREMVDKAVQAARTFFGDAVPDMVFNPNLFTPYSADFVRMGHRVVTISSVPDAETMLHETMHTAVAQHRDIITAFAETHGLGNFADREKMIEFGYMEDDSATSVAHVIEECFVRALAVVLSGGSDERLQFHAEYGCGSVPFIASRTRRVEPSISTLRELIVDVLSSR